MATQKSQKDSGTFNATISVDPHFSAAEVKLHKFAGEKPAGYIRGTKNTLSIFIGFPTGIVDNQKVTKKYPDDFNENDPKWVLFDGTNSHHVKTGSITVTFTEGMTKAKGEFEFITDDSSPRTVTGEFDVQQS
ncbi:MULTISPECIES: hypothetical protein [Pseudomonas]|jgi:hypothetical protein|uniref:Uncharacterized protein n=2 Tax=Pseudomonas fluorescens group TaxID=136843 RepID=A0ABY0VE96_9PSED|nr:MULTISPECIES: hypothetical protein [Pseudomonas]MBA4361524.1 hypothetical protein [Pseudomonas sp.]MBU0520881.1 hypothetical protein [Gammaproteobacteria bacterium]MDF9883029.1 hypothetical protein [Pseudomonas silensiensis]MBU0818728.1 hypothetical protein [Gammaproteobacteria bacterium]MBU0841783.1 hypothetical protein [Gammaproteobacteria bacterium]